MNIKIQSYEKQKIHSFMGLPECALKNGCWTIKCEAKYPLHILNLYRKVMMSKVGVYKLKVKYFETDDPFLINEFIQTRIKQIPINQSQAHQQMEYELNVTNPISQEMCVYSDHIRIRDKYKQDPELCDSLMLFKLGIGKKVQIIMQHEMINPESDDKHRGLMITVYEDETDQPSMEFISQREESLMSITSLGSFEMDQFKQLRCTNILSQIFNNQVNTIESQNSYKQQQIVVILNNLPQYMLDPILIEIMPFLHTKCKQILPTQTIGNIPCIIIVPDIDFDITETGFKNMILDGIQRIQQQIQQFEQELFSCVNSFMIKK